MSRCSWSEDCAVVRIDSQNILGPSTYGVALARPDNATGAGIMRPLLGATNAQPCSDLGWPDLPCLEWFGWRWSGNGRSVGEGGQFEEVGGGIAGGCGLLGLSFWRLMAFGGGR